MGNADVKATGFYQQKKWTRTAQRVRARDGYMCQKCNCFIKRKQHFVHHIVELTIDNYKDEAIAFNEDNLILLCAACHRKEHKELFSPEEVRKKKLAKYFNPPGE